MVSSVIHDMIQTLSHRPFKSLSATSQEKCIECIHCFYGVNEMVYIIITIVNIPLSLYHVFLGNVYMMELLQL